MAEGEHKVGENVCAEAEQRDENEREEHAVRRENGRAVPSAAAVGLHVTTSGHTSTARQSAEIQSSFNLINRTRTLCTQ